MTLAASVPTVAAFTNTFTAYGFNGKPTVNPTANSTDAAMVCTKRSSTNLITTGGVSFTVQDDYNNFLQYDLDVKAMVQALVTDFDFSNDAMMFFVRGEAGKSAASYDGRIYMQEKGPTNSPRLIINFTPASTAPPDKTTYHHG
jgi:hypothetical protein